MNNPWLHNQVLLVFEARRGIWAQINTPPQTNETAALKAYHLLGDEIFLTPEARPSGDALIVTDGHRGRELQLLPDGRLSGQAEGAARLSIELIHQELNTVIIALRQRRLSEARSAARIAFGKARQVGLLGHASLFAWNEAKALFAEGRVREAVRILDEAAAANPALSVDLRVWKALYLVLDPRGDSPPVQPMAFSHESIFWRHQDLQCLKVWLGILAGDREAAFHNTDLGPPIIPEDDYFAESARLQQGWWYLLYETPEKALIHFQHHLKQPWMEEHIAGMYLAAALMDPPGKAPEVAKSLIRARPLILELAQAIHAGDDTGARTAWTALLNERPHVLNSAIYCAVLERLIRKYPARLRALSEN